MKKITPVFGPQELFDGAPDDAELVDATGRAYKIECGKLFRKTPIQWVVAGKFEAIPLAQRHIIRTPTWTKADQLAGKLPEVGAEVIGSLNEVGTVTAVDEKRRKISLKYEDGGLQILSDIAISPIETPDEKAARLENEFYLSVKKDWNLSISNKDESFELGVRAAYRRLNGELPPAQAKDGV